MTHEVYRRIAQEFCDAVSLPDSSRLIDSQHVAIDGTTVALLHDAQNAPDVLFVYFDLGPIPGAMRHRVHEGMLRSNLRPDPDVLGHFGVHPETGNAVWEVRFRKLAELDGAALARFVVEQVEGLQGWMNRVADPVRGVAA